MKSFLQLFSEYRKLQARVVSLVDVNHVAIRECDTLNVILADLRKRLEDERAQNRELIAQVSAAQRSEIESTRKVADSLARRYSGPIFDLASEIPTRTEAFDPIPKTRIQPNTAIALMEQEFLAEVAAIQGKQAN